MKISSLSLSSLFVGAAIAIIYIQGAMMMMMVAAVSTAFQGTVLMTQGDEIVSASCDDCPDDDSWLEVPVVVQQETAVDDTDSPSTMIYVQQTRTGNLVVQRSITSNNDASSLVLLWSSNVNAVPVNDDDDGNENRYYSTRLQRDCNLVTTRRQHRPVIAVKQVQVQEPPETMVVWSSDTVAGQNQMCFWGLASYTTTTMNNDDDAAALQIWKGTPDNPVELLWSVAVNESSGTGGPTFTDQPPPPSSATSPPTTTTTTTTTNQQNNIAKCPDQCNAHNCQDSACQHCEFYCGGGRCLYRSNSSNNTGNNNPGQSSNTNTCSLGITFTDITAEKFLSSQDAYWYHARHSGRPGNPETGPLLVDLNDDGILDFFKATHQEPMELAETVKETGNDTYQLRQVSHRIQLTTKQQDSHGQALVDLDGDGIQDILVAVGGGLGGTHDVDPLTRDNMLLWGQQQQQQKQDTIFRGGQDTARAAGVNGRMRRGRFNFVFDANGDGLLDLFLAADRPRNNGLVPGVLLINQGDRTWREESNVKEYSKAMMLTDADGDGFANEFVINRDACFPERNGPGVDANFPEYGPFSSEILDFCKTRPVGTTAVYKFRNGRMVNIEKRYSNVSAARAMQPPCCQHGSMGPFKAENQDCFVKSMASGDFDGDLLADQIFLYDSKMVFFFSSDRERGVLPFAKQIIGAEIDFPDYCIGQSVRVIDLNNDSKEEILVACSRPGTFLIYSRRTADKADWTLDNGCNNGRALGDLNSITRSKLVTTDDYITACEYNRGADATKLCNYYQTGTQPPFRTRGLTTGDLNNDGFTDFVVAHQMGRLLFFQNTPGAQARNNRFIAFKLKGRGPGVGNAYGIGATLILYARNIMTDDSDQVTTQFREISSYQLHDKFGYQDDRIIFGLGPAGVPIRLDVRWPNGNIGSYDLGQWDFSSRLNPVLIEQ